MYKYNKISSPLVNLGELLGLLLHVVEKKHQWMGLVQVCIISPENKFSIGNVVPDYASPKNRRFVIEHYETVDR
jgi:hypothetical protein